MDYFEVRADDYRRRVRQCIELALQIKDEAIRTEILDLAFMWGRLAKGLEYPGVLRTQPQDGATPRRR
jgi:hypothetical protein